MDIILDLDGTLVSMDRRLGKYRAGGDAYAPLHGCSEFLLALGSTPGIQISFFSFGRQSRNEELAAQLVCDTLSLVTDGEEIPGLKHYRVFSQGDTDSGGSKRLQTLIHPKRLDAVVMVDDMASAVCAQDEETNFLPVYSGDFQFNGAGVTYPDAVFSVRRDNSLVRVLGMLLWCLTTSERYKVGLVQALTNLQWDPASRRYRHRATNSEKIYSLGLEAMRRFNPEFELVDREHRGVVPWSPPLAELNPRYQSHAIVWYQHFGFREEQVERICSSSFGIWNLPVRELQRGFKGSVEVNIGGMAVNLPESLSADAIKSVAEDILAYGLMKRNFELVKQASGKFSLVLQKLELCDFDKMD